MKVIVEDDQVTWLMERHGIPEFLREHFEMLIWSELNKSNYLDGVFYRYKKELTLMAEHCGYKLVPKSYEIEKAEEQAEEQLAAESTVPKEETC